MYRINQNQEIVRLLLKLKEVDEVYPAQLLYYRRMSFLLLTARYASAFIRLRTETDRYPSRPYL